MKEYLNSIRTIIQKDKDEKNLPIDLYLLMLGVLFGASLVFAPQIYIKNNIYYKSRAINTLYLKYQALYGENKKIKITLERMYFQQKNKNYKKLMDNI